MASRQSTMATTSGAANRFVEINCPYLSYLSRYAILICIDEYIYSKMDKQLSTYMIGSFSVHINTNVIRNENKTTRAARADRCALPTGIRPRHQYIVFSRCGEWWFWWDSGDMRLDTTHLLFPFACLLATKTQEFSWCSLCRHWRHSRLPPLTTK